MVPRTRGAAQGANPISHRSSRDHVQSLERGLAVIRAFDASRPRLTLTEVAELTAIPKASARRFLNTLVELGYVDVHQHLFSLRPRVLELGYSYLSSARLPDVAEPHLKHLAQTVGESVSLSVLDGAEVVYVARVASHRIISVDLVVGARLPSYATSMGRVLLAALPEQAVPHHLGPLERRTEHTLTDTTALLQELAHVRDQGWALVDEELEEGLRALAAPVRGFEGHVVGAINIATAVGGRPADVFVADNLSELLKTADRISTDLRARGANGLAPTAPNTSRMTFSKEMRS